MLTYTPCDSAETVGARALLLGSVPVLPAGRTRAHVDEHHESAFYMVSGDEVDLWPGDQLQHREVAHTGDYLYIRPGCARRGQPQHDPGSSWEPARTPTSRRGRDAPGVGQTL